MVAFPIHRQAQAISKLHVLRIERETLTEEIRGRVPFARLHREDAALVMRFGAVDEPVVLLHQRIGEARPAVAALFQMRLGPLLLTEASIALRQWVMHAGRLGVQRQGLLQVLHRMRLVSPCLGDAAQPFEGRRGARVDVARP